MRVDEPISSGEASCRGAGPQSMRTTWCWGKWLGLAPQWAKSCFVKEDWDVKGGGGGVWFVGEILTLGFCQREIWDTVLFCWCSIRGNYFGHSMCFRFWHWCWLPSVVGAWDMPQQWGCGFGSHEDYTHTKLGVKRVQRVANPWRRRTLFQHWWDFYWNCKYLCVNAERLVIISAWWEVQLQQAHPYCEHDSL